MNKALWFAALLPFPSAAQIDPGTLSPRQVQQQLNRDLQGRFEAFYVPRYPEPPAHVAAGLISVDALRHKIPKPAKKLFEDALKQTKKREYQASLDLLEKAVAIDPEFARAHGNLGVVYGRMNRYPEAESELRRAIQLSPGNTLDYSNLAVVLFRMNHYVEAINYANYALELDAGNPGAHLVLGVVYQDRSHLQIASRTIPGLKEWLEKNK